MTEEPHVTSYGSPYYDGPDTNGGSGLNSSGTTAYFSQPAVGSERENHAMDAAEAAEHSAFPLVAPSGLTKAQEASLTPRDAGRSTHSPPIVVIANHREIESHASSDGSTPPPPLPPKSVRHDSLTSSTANTALTASETSTEAVAGLRQEMQDLRRMMQRMHEERLEAPPQYDE